MIGDDLELQDIYEDIYAYAGQVIFSLNFSSSSLQTSVIKTEQ